MQHSTLHVRVLEAPSSPNDLLAFAFLSSPITNGLLLTLIGAATIQNTPLLIPTGARIQLRSAIPD